METLTPLALYDDLIRSTNILTNGSCEPEFLRFVLNQCESIRQWKTAVEECKRLQQELDSANNFKTDLEMKLKHARRFLDAEKKKRRKVEDELLTVMKQMAMVRDLVLGDDSKVNINNETKEKLAFLNHTNVKSRRSSVLESLARQSAGQKMSTITEVFDSTGTLLSDLSYSRSDDDLDYSVIHGRGWKKHKPSTPAEEPIATKRRRSNNHNKSIELEGLSGERLVATTTVTVSREGPVKASSRIDTAPSQEFISPRREPLHEIQPTAPPKSSSTESGESEMSVAGSPGPLYMGFNSGKDKLNSRAHVFVQKTILRSETCEPCGKRMKFSKLAVKCRDCRASSHVECKDLLPLPCVPASGTPNRKGYVGLISDFVPTVPPLIPALILHCINEIEKRGFSEVGLYRVPGSEKDVKMLKEKFLRGRGAPNLSGVDVHVLCGTVKDFLRSLREPLVTHALWPDFIRCLDSSDHRDRQNSLHQVISDLPRPNRDTLAYVVLHLVRVSLWPDCKMPASNLSKVFGPTLVGYSSVEPEAMAIMMETRKAVEVVDLMISLGSSYWSGFINVDSVVYSNQRTPDIRSTPTVGSLSQPSSVSRGFFTPSSRLCRNKRFFKPPTHT